MHNSYRKKAKALIYFCDFEKFAILLSFRLRNRVNYTYEIFYILFRLVTLLIVYLFIFLLIVFNFIVEPLSAFNFH